MTNRKRVFLSYASEDTAWVRGLYDLLQSVQVEPWMAPQRITTGAKWRNVIRKALKNTDFVIACLSQYSVAKQGYVQREFRTALDLCQEMPEDKIFLIPLRLTPCKVPDLQVSGLNLRELHWLDSYSEGSLKKMLAALGISNTNASNLLLRRSGEDTSITAGIYNLLRHRSFDPYSITALTASSVIDFDRNPIIILNEAHTGFYEEGESLIGRAVGHGKSSNRFASPNSTEGPTIITTSMLETGVPTTKVIQNDIDSSELVVVPAGDFISGDSQMEILYSNQLPSGDERIETTRAYAISRYLITIEQFQGFLIQSKYDCKVPISNDDLVSRANYPITNVTWFDAVNYCRWAGGRLPSVSEWEKAARGIDGRPYPWGWYRPNDNYCNFGNPNGGPTSINRYPAGVSPFGCFDMAGNVWEWCATRVKKAELANFDQAALESLGKSPYYIVKGGSYYHEATACRAAGSFFGSKYTRSPLWGFRLAMDVKGVL